MPCVGAKTTDGNTSDVVHVHAILPTLQPWQTITHLIDIRAHSGSTNDTIGTLTFVPAPATYVSETNVKICAACFTSLLRPKRKQHSFSAGCEVPEVHGAMILLPALFQTTSKCDAILWRQMLTCDLNMKR